MSEHSIAHHRFTLERSYEASPAQVWAAWSDPQVKRRWFAGSVDHYELDFRRGGRELVRTRTDSGQAIAFEAVLRDIVPQRRIVWSSSLSMDDTLATLAITVVELEPDGIDTELRVTEQGTFLDGHEQPNWREEGTGSWLDKLAAELAEQAPAAD